jgi:hypothetical protein
MRGRTAASACCVALLLAGGLASAARADGSFESSDSQVNLIWRDSVQTARDMVSPPVNLDRRGCDIDIPTVLLDGVQRDRCPYIGDQAVTGMTLLVANDDVSVLRGMLAWFASVQADDGSIPASPFDEHSLQLIDYNAYWIESLYDYVLYTGDTALLRQVWPNLVELVDGFYPAHVAQGLLVNWLGAADYAYIPRAGTRVAYYNAQYVRALKLAAALAGWYGDSQRADRWRGRAADTAAAFGPAFWDPVAGAFRDTTADSDVHALDGNAFAILAGLATPAQAQSVLAYVDRTMKRSYGNSVADTSGWRGLNWGDGDYRRVYPFISYFEVLARYAAGADASALDLIRREWGFMATRGPGTMWETISNEFGGQVDSTPSWDHGWSSGAAPALTSYVLGVQPTSPGFATFSVTPHPSGLTSAQGVVPTRHGPIRVSWSLVAGKVSLQVTAPPGTLWENAPAPTVRPPVPSKTVPAPPAADTDGTDDATSPPPSDDTTAAASGAAQNVVQQVGRRLKGAWHAAGGW